MSETLENTGKCLCGATHFTAYTMSKNIGACHCDMCRKWGGGPLLVTDCGTAVTFEDENSITVFNSSDWAERGFCKHCGTHLFYRLKESGQYYIPVGLFDDGSAFIFDHQIFIEEKPPYYCFANETENMTGAEMFAKFAPTSE
jgi:hypothetical protein